MDDEELVRFLALGEPWDDESGVSGFGNGQDGIALMLCHAVTIGQLGG
jgi:hypothetical protein